VTLGQRPSLYLCTPVREDLERFVTACVRGGVDVVQLRDKVHDDATLLDAATRLATLCRTLGVPFVVNDRCDLALLAGADGVHVGQDDVGVERCRELLRDEAIVGLSTHDERQLARAVLQPVTYLSAGPVEATPTKPGRPGTGLDYVAAAVTASPVPVFVTGGVSVATLPALTGAGVRHVVVVRALTESPNPERAAGELKAALLAGAGTRV